MFRRAYKVVANAKFIYRSFPTQEEASAYINIVLPRQRTEVKETEEYPNSRFLNNRALDLRQRHIGGTDELQSAAGQN